MALSDYLPGIAQAGAEAAKALASINAMRFDAMIQKARILSEERRTKNQIFAEAKFHKLQTDTQKETEKMKADARKAEFDAEAPLRQAQMEAANLNKRAAIADFERATTEKRLAGQDSKEYRMAAVNKGIYDIMQERLQKYLKEVKTTNPDTYEETKHYVVDPDQLENYKKAYKALNDFGQKALGIPPLEEEFAKPFQGPPMPPGWEKLTSEQRQKLVDKLSGGSDINNWQRGSFQHFSVPNKPIGQLSSTTMGTGLVYPDEYEAYLRHLKEKNLLARPNWNYESIQSPIGQKEFR